MLNISFVNRGADEGLIKSMATDEFHEYDQEELDKALDRSKLVQKEVQYKTKTGKIATRKQWVKVGEDKGTDKGSKSQDGGEFNRTKGSKLTPKFEWKKDKGYSWEDTIRVGDTALVASDDGVQALDESDSDEYVDTDDVMFNITEVGSKSYGKKIAEAYAKGVNSSKKFSWSKDEAFEGELTMESGSFTFVTGENKNGWNIQAFKDDEEMYKFMVEDIKSLDKAKKIAEAIASGLDE